MIAMKAPRRIRGAQRTYDKHLCKERHSVKCIFKKTKWYRRRVARAEKRAAYYFGFLSFVFTLMRVG